MFENIDGISHRIIQKHENYVLHSTKQIDSGLVPPSFARGEILGGAFCLINKCVQRIDFMTHIIEHPFRHLIESIDRKSTGRNEFWGAYGSELPICRVLPRWSFSLNSRLEHQLQKRFLQVESKIFSSGEYLHGLTDKNLGKVVNPGD